MWDSHEADIQFQASTEQEIHALVKVPNTNSTFLLSAIYASPRYRERKILWENLETIAETHKYPWLALGDFNEILCESEKFGGRPISWAKSLRFAKMINKCSFLGLGFSGPRFTWTNLQQPNCLIQERLIELQRMVLGGNYVLMQKFFTSPESIRTIDPYF